MCTNGLIQKNKDKHELIQTNVDEYRQYRPMQTNRDEYKLVETNIDWYRLIEANMTNTD